MKKKPIILFLSAFLGLGALLFTNKTVEPVKADNPNFRLVGNIVNRNDWDNNNDKWIFTEFEGGWIIRNVYMIYAHADSNFRIVTKGSWTQDYGYSQIVVNDAGFTSAGTDNNIHITKTGYYDIRIYDNNTKIDITKYNSTKTTLECQVWLDGTKVPADTRFDFSFTYNDNETTLYSSLDSYKRLDVTTYTKFFVNNFTMPKGVYFSDYRLGYTDNTDSYDLPGTTATNYKYAMPKLPNDARINYIIFYFWTTPDGAQKDYPFIVNAYDGVISDGFFNCDVGILCSGGGIQNTYVAKVSRLGNTKLGTAIIPNGTRYMRVVRAPSGTFDVPTVTPSDVFYNTWDKLTFDYSKNVITIKGWATNNQEYTDNKVVLLAGMPVFFDTGDNPMWLTDNATPYAVTGAISSDWYGYTSSEGWYELTQIGGSGYIYFVPTVTIIAPQVIVTRNAHGKSGWNNKWNQTTNMTVNYRFNPLYTTMVESGKSGDNYNWGNKGATETASEYGFYFMDKITCTGGGAVTHTLSDWETVSDFYDTLTKDVRDTVATAEANQSGNNIQQAMARYDYILFFKGYSGYTDFLNRGSLLGLRYFGPRSIIDSLFTENSSSLIIIILTGLTTVGALAFFIKRRKQRNS